MGALPGSLCLSASSSSSLPLPLPLALALPLSLSVSVCLSVSLMASAAVKAEGAELFKRGITLQKLGDSSVLKFEAGGEEGDGIRAFVHYGQAAEVRACVRACACGR